MTLPYPVLGVNDDIESDFSYDISQPEDDGEKYIFTFKITVDDPDILRLIAEGKAEYVCEINCSKTFFRRCYGQATGDFVIELPKYMVGGRIQFEVTVTANKDINNYAPLHANEDYAGESFDLSAGDLLAYIVTFNYDADIKYDKLQAVGTFMQIEEAFDGATMSSVYLLDDKISIRLPKQMFEDYANKLRYNIKVASVIHGSLVFNALLQALYAYNGNLRKYLWARTLEYRLQTEETLKKFWVQVPDDAEDPPFDKNRVY